MSSGSVLLGQTPSSTSFWGGPPPSAPALTPEQKAALGAELLSLATDPETPPGQLERAFHEAKRTDQPSRIKRALAGHPNTPADLLAQLAVQYPYVFCHNPVAPLLPLECPDFLNEIGLENLSCLLRQADLPMSVVMLILAQAQGNPVVSEDARQHVTLAGEIEGAQLEEEVGSALNRMVASMGVWGRCQVIEAVEVGKLPESIIKEIPDPLAGVPPVASPLPPGGAERRTAVLEQARYELDLDGKSCRAARQLLRQVVRQVAEGAESEEVRQALDPGATEGQWEALCTQAAERHDIALGLIWNVRTPAAVLERLVSQGQVYPKCHAIFARSLARHPNISSDLLSRVLARNADATLRRLLVRRPDMPEEIASGWRAIAAKDADRSELLFAMRRALALPDPALRQWPRELRAAITREGWLERLGAVRDPLLWTTMDSRGMRTLRKALTNDGNRLVRAAAREQQARAAAIAHRPQYRATL